MTNSAMKRRERALRLAIVAVGKLTIRDPEYLKVRLLNGDNLQPADINAILLAACRFDRFLEGKEWSLEMSVTIARPAEPDASTETADSNAEVQS